MIKPELKKLLEDMGKSPYGRALREFLDEKYDEIKDVNKIPEDADHAIESKARKHACKVIRDLFSAMTEKSQGSNKKSPYE